MVRENYYKYIEDDDAFRRLDLRHVIVGSIVFIIAGIIAFIATRQIEVTSAADLTKFQAGYIISDYVMTKSNSMTEAEIQKFLKSKNACNDKNIAKAENYPHLKYNIKDGHFVCMADDLFDNVETGKQETAAHIIWQAAQDYKINPQVLIVLLEKEQGLVTDTWPNDRQYRVATGYGCPDNAACDSKYYGFRNQIRNAAKLFNTVMNGGWTNYPLGNNYIQYNPDKSCGGSIVDIKNLATSALYRYTPYQPNAAAIAAYTGTAKCGAYGNRNFFIYFENWFGDITASAPVTTAPVTTTPSNTTANATTNTTTSANSNSSAATSNTPGSSNSTNSNTATPIANNSASQAPAQNTSTTPQTPAAPTYNITGAAQKVWSENQALVGKVISNLQQNTRTGIQWYDCEKGVIVGNDKKGWFVSTGKSREVWKAQGFESGALGFPTSNFKKNTRTGMEWQEYEGGMIVGNDKKGWFLSMGGSRKTWQLLGFESGALGFPKSNFSCNQKSGICWQEYEGGLIVGNDKKGWFESRGSIRTKWQKSGFEFGRYGFPTSNIVNGRQKYEHGTIYQ